jgi:protein subunit release factor A
MEQSMKLNIEIRPGEGGEDARLLSAKLAKIYMLHAERIQVSAKMSLYPG